MSKSRTWGQKTLDLKVWLLSSVSRSLDWNLFSFFLFLFERRILILVFDGLGTYINGVIISCAPRLYCSFIKRRWITTQNLWSEDCHALGKAAWLLPLLGWLLWFVAIFSWLHCEYLFSKISVFHVFPGIFPTILKVAILALQVFPLFMSSLLVEFNPLELQQDSKHDKPVSSPMHWLPRENPQNHPCIQDSLFWCSVFFPYGQLGSHSLDFNMNN